MNTSAAIGLVLAVAVLAANLPFLTNRLGLLGPRREVKAVGWHLLELAMLFAATLGLGRLLESRLGQAHPQGWEFYAAAACLFLTLAFPGFVWRYLRRRS